MLRRLTKDAGRFKSGTLHDWPKVTWDGVMTDAGFKTLDEFSKAEEQDAILQQRGRLGGKQVRGLSRTQRSQTKH